VKYSQRMTGKTTAAVTIAGTDLPYQIGVTRIGAQGIQCEVGPENDQPGVVLLVCRIEPLEGMLRITASNPEGGDAAFF
jgi:hypothetical protein